MEVVNISVNDLVPYKKNPRRNDEAVRGVARSIEEFGFKVPIVIDKDKVIIAGHTRLKAAKHLGMKEVPCIVADDLTDEQIKAFRLADNRVSEVSQWDENLLAIELEELAEIGFDMTAFDFDLEAWNIDSDSKSNDKEEIDYKEATQHLTENILNLGYAQYAGAGLYDIPILEPVRHIPKIEEWVGFNYALTATNRKKKGVHFYVDDYQFERVWNRPEAYLDVLSQFGAVMTPDFSPYGDMPLATQIFNHYRKHWVGAFWQENGLTVIPTIRASTDPRSMEFYLDGEPKGGIVSISTMWATRSEKELKEEIRKAVKELEPSKLLIYGEVFDWIESYGIDIEQITTFAKRRWG